MNQDFFQTLLEIKEISTRTETKVDAMSGFESRISSLEDDRNKVIGALWFVGVAWGVLLA